MNTPFFKYLSISTKECMLVQKTYAYFGGQFMLINQLRRQIKEIRYYLLTASIIFILGIITGWLYGGSFTQHFENQLDSFRKINTFIETQQNPQMALFLMILINNLVKGILVIYLGFGIAIVPIIMLISNGLLLGYLFSIQPTEILWSLFFKGILPHGIIEIPAILIACAYGLKIGIHVIKLILNKFFRNRFKDEWQELKKSLITIKWQVIFLTICFLLAALIESTITFWLMSI